MHTVIHEVFHIREIHTILSKLWLELQTSNHQPYYEVTGKHIADMLLLKYQMKLQCSKFQMLKCYILQLKAK